MSQALIQPLDGRGRGALPPGAKLRVAVVGCGEVSRRFHLPVLAGHEEIEIVVLVDRDLARARSLGQEYGVTRTSDDATKLDLALIDAAVIATPPCTHAAVSIDLLRRGRHILVEKPMATCYADALAMVEAAEKTGAVLSVGLFRRLLPGLHLLKAAIDSKVLGVAKSFALEGGAIYGWAAATLGNMRKELSGGGVLMDMGPHFLDQLLFLFDGPGEVLNYEHDSFGGIEADCRLELRLSNKGRPIEGRVELSRLRNLGNALTVRCERGVLELPPGERYRVRVKPDSLKLADPTTLNPREAQIDAAWSDEPETPWYETFRLQIDDWLNAIRSGHPPTLSGRSALPTAEIIDECYRNATRSKQVWIEHPMCRAADRSTHESPQSRRILVTGASGFIGCRVAEILSRRPGYRVRALVHDPAHASRVARLDVELVQADLRSPMDVRAAVAGCEAVVHCAVGTSYGNRRDIFRVTVGGTQNLVDAALESRVGRFVHLSSIAVHGEDASGVIDESTPIRPGRDEYATSKAAAERAVLDSGERGLPVVVLRPACVYGPYGTTFVTRPIERLTRGLLVLRGSADTPSNTVYVDNLVEAIVRSLEADVTIAGEVFAIADDDGLTWGDFYGYFTRPLGATLQIAEARDSDDAAVEAGWWRAFREIVASSEMKSLAKKILYTDPIGRFPRSALERSPRLKRWLRRRLQLNQPFVYVRDAGTPGELLEITPRHAEVRSEKVRRVLKYQPSISRQAALELTLEWLRFMRLC